MDLLNKLNWRYATKRMNNEEIDEKTIKSILTAIQLSPSSYGLQPYHLFIVKDKEIKKQIAPIAYNQPQIIESSHLLIFSAWKNTETEQINEFINLTARKRNMDISELSEFKEMMIQATTNRPEDINFHWAAKQAYLALGIAIVAAAEYLVDATPMEGFDSDQLDRLLQLDEKGLKSTTILALGYRDEKTDNLSNMEKVRKPMNDLITIL